MRTIRGYCEALIADYRDALPEAGRTLLETVAAGAARTDGLIDDLLTFCRFGRQAIVKRPVDCGRLVDSVRANLKAMQGDREIIWTSHRCRLAKRMHRCSSKSSATCYRTP